MKDTDVLIVGGGPAGYTAALAAASRKASVILIEAEHLGGACVNSSCIPTTAQIDPVLETVHHEVLRSAGIFDTALTPSLRALQRHRTAIVGGVRSAVDAALAVAGVEVLVDRARLTEPCVAKLDSGRTINAKSVVLATGSRWEVPEVPGARPSLVITPDTALDLTEPPDEIAVLGASVGGTSFALEYASYFAALGSSTTLLLPRGQTNVVAEFDSALDGRVREGLEVLGIKIAATENSGKPPIADAIVAVDCRAPLVTGLGLDDLDLDTTAGLVVDDWAQTKIDGLYAAGDVTGTGMTSASAAAQGRVAGLNAAGGEHHAFAQLRPCVAATVPPLAWVGVSPSAVEGQADIGIGTAQVAHNPVGALTGFDGAVRVAANVRTGEVLGVHMVGPGANQVIETAAALIQAEVTYQIIAEMIVWHPSPLESLRDAARAVR